MKRFLSSIIIVVLMLSCCSISAIAEKLTVYHDYQLASKEMESWLILKSQSGTDMNVLNNCLDSLVYNDNHSNLCGLAAESFEHNSTSTEWTFHLRDNMTWVDNQGNYKADVTSADWLTALEWVLNYSKNGSSNTSMMFETISGAEDYYNYTKELAEQNEDSAKALDYTGKFSEMVGIEAPDDYTLIYKCFAPCPYFATIATYSCMYPLSQGMIDELGIEGVQALQYDTMWYNGCYTVTTYIEGSEKILTKNPLYWNADSDRFDEVVITMVESADKAYELFDAGQLDYISLGQAQLTAIMENPENKFYNNLVEARPTSSSYQMHFVYDKWLEDGSKDEQWNTAIANEAFRLSLYYGMDLTQYLSRTNPIHPYSCTNYGYTASGVSVNSEGVDYAAIVNNYLGQAYSSTEYTRYQPELASEYKDKAIKELTEKGVIFPVQIDYYIAGNDSTAAGTALILKQVMEECLGNDYVNLNIKTYVSSIVNEVRKPHLASILITGWGADYGDPVNFLGQETYGEDSAFYSNNYSYINDATDPDLISTYKEFTFMVVEAREIADDLDARYDAFAKAEVFFIQHALTIPLNLNVSWELTKINDYSKRYAAFGSNNNHYENWESSATLYTTDEYEQFKAAYNAE